MNKKQLIDDLLTEVKAKRINYHKKMLRYKKLDDVTEALLIGCDAIGVSSLFITLQNLNMETMIIATTFSTIGSVGGAIKRVVNLVGKFESFKTSYNQLSDLERESRIILARNHLTSNDCEDLLNSISQRLSLIEDSSLPIEIKIESEKKSLLNVTV